MATFDTSVVRACLKNFLGEPEYLKFLEVGATEPLKYWQEKAWEQFVSVHTEMKITSAERARFLQRGLCKAGAQPHRPLALMQWRSCEAGSCRSAFTLSIAPP